MLPLSAPRIVGAGLPVETRIRLNLALVDQPGNKESTVCSRWNHRLANRGKIPLELIEVQTGAISATSGRKSDKPSLGRP